ncbi:MAG TPA: prepilin-type N-terminal cleavage/methylation domain-containing protein [Verrucomicrobiae bacterium]
MNINADFRRVTAFTLVELLVTIAIIAIIASLLFPALARSKAAGKRIVCTSNVKQLAIALQMYLNEYNDYYPAANPVGAFQDEEWLRWNPLQSTSFKPSDRTNLLSSGIVPYLGRFSTNLFDCPADTVLSRFRRKYQSFADFVRYNQYYHFSYTLSSPLWASAIAPRDYSVKNGVASTSVLNGNGEHILYKMHSSRISTPSEKIVFADEMMLYEYQKTPAPSDFLPAASAGWNWPIDKLTSRHSRRGVTSFADGHVEAILPSVAAQRKHYDPLY